MSNSIFTKIDETCMNYLNKPGVKILHTREFEGKVFIIVQEKHCRNEIKVFPTKQWRIRKLRGKL